MIIGDTNLLVYLYVESDFTPQARQVHAIDPDWIFPPVARSEATNVLATLTRGKRLTPEAAASALERLEPRLATGFREVPMNAVLTLAIECGISAYDAQFIVLARQSGVFLVTEDGKLKTRFPDVAVSMESFIKGVGGKQLREPRAPYGRRRKR
jgi:predicted nucleic acid-binding protein